MQNIVRLKVLASIGAASAFAFLFVQACGGGDNTADAGPDATSDVATDNVTESSSNDVANDTTGNDGGTCPTYSGASAFCKAAVAKCGTCGTSTLNLSSCQLANFTAVCDHIAVVFSQAAANAATACEAICGSDAGNACVKADLADAALTTAQQKLATDYCARCGTSAGCAAQIAANLNLAEYSDTVATDIDNACTPDAGGPDSSACGLGYGGCAFGQLGSFLNGGPCSDAGGG